MNSFYSPEELEKIGLNKYGYWKTSWKYSNDKN